MYIYIYNHGTTYSGSSSGSSSGVPTGLVGGVPGHIAIGSRFAISAVDLRFQQSI